jgi:drug/metabolite transporter (DMT)-like permease
MAFAVPRIGASLLSIVYTLPPMLTYLFALGIGMERRSLIRAAGIGLGLAGALLIVLPENSLPAPELYGWMALAFSIPVIVAVGNIYRQLDWPTGAGALPLASGMLLAAAVELVPVIIITGDWYWPLALATVGDWTLLIQMAATALSFILYFELQRRAGVVYFSQIGYVVTLSGVLIGMIAFGERLSPWVWGAVALMAGGLYLVNRRPPAPAG